MTVVKWEPFQDLLTMQDRMTRLFDETLARLSREERQQRGLWSPPVDLVEQENQILLKMDIPEMSQSEIDIKVEENILTIRGERKLVKETPEDHYIQIERPYGAFRRQFTLPKQIDQSKIKANYRDGVLQIVLPKGKEDRPKQVQVQVK